MTGELLTVYHQLRQQHGPQHWWPAETVFEVMIGAILTQNTAWRNVEHAIANLKRANSLSAAAILNCSVEQLAELIRPSGYFNVKALRLRNYCQWYVDAGEFDELQNWSTGTLRTALLNVNGVGPETADDILLYAFERPVFVVDAYTRRIFSRLGTVDAGIGYEDLRSVFETAVKGDARIFGEYHALIVMHGKDICKTRPRCTECILQNQCDLMVTP